MVKSGRLQEKCYRECGKTSKGLCKYFANIDADLLFTEANTINI